MFPTVLFALPVGPRSWNETDYSLLPYFIYLFFQKDFCFCLCLVSFVYCRIIIHFIMSTNCSKNISISCKLVKTKLEGVPEHYSCSLDIQPSVTWPLPWSCSSMHSILGSWTEPSTFECSTHHLLAVFKSAMN